MKPGFPQPKLLPHRRPLRRPRILAVASLPSAGCFHHSPNLILDSSSPHCPLPIEHKFAPSSPPPPSSPLSSFPFLFLASSADLSQPLRTESRRPALTIIVETLRLVMGNLDCGAIQIVLWKIRVSYLILCCVKSVLLDTKPSSDYYVWRGVIALNLSGLNLDGEISPAIGDLKTLLSGRKFFVHDEEEEVEFGSCGFVPASLVAELYIAMEVFCKIWITWSRNIGISHDLQLEQNQMSQRRCNSYVTTIEYIVAAKYTKVKNDLKSLPLTSTLGFEVTLEGKSSWPLKTCLFELKVTHFHCGSEAVNHISNHSSKDQRVGHFGHRTRSSFCARLIGCLFASLMSAVVFHSHFTTQIL